MVMVECPGLLNEEPFTAPGVATKGENGSLHLRLVGLQLRNTAAKYFPGQEESPSMVVTKVIDGGPGFKKLIRTVNFFRAFYLRDFVLAGWSYEYADGIAHFHFKRDTPPVSGVRTMSGVQAAEMVKLAAAKDAEIAVKEANIAAREAQAAAREAKMAAWEAEQEMGLGKGDKRSNGGKENDGDNNNGDK